MAKHKPTSRLPKIPAPLVKAVAEYCRADKDNSLSVLTEVLRVNAHPDARPAVMAVTAYDAAIRGRELLNTPIMTKPLGYLIPKGTTSTAVSPHAPVAKGSRPYWVKVVTSVDDSDRTAYGVKGRFINCEDVEKLPENTLVMVMTKHKTKRLVYVLRSKHGKPTNIPFPAHSPNPPLVVSGSVLLKGTDPGERWWEGTFNSLIKRGVKSL